jgi:hypothetical protein
MILFFLQCYLDYSLLLFSHTSMLNLKLDGSYMMPLSEGHLDWTPTKMYFNVSTLSL